MTQKLAKQLSKSYEDFFKGKSSIKVKEYNGGLNHLEVIIPEDRTISYYAQIEREVFKTNEIAIFPITSDELYKQVLEINEKVAIKRGCAQINTRALDDKDIACLKRRGYNFNGGSHIGVKRLKWRKH